MQVISYIQDHALAVPSLQTILYGGEAMYPDQRAYVKKVLPQLRCRSIGWASVDGGMLGFSGANCATVSTPFFRKPLIRKLWIRILLKPITEIGKVGKILLTNLTRKLMPIIRYPVGDMGAWVDNPLTTAKPRIRLNGRSDEAARVGPATLYLSDVRDVLKLFATQLPAFSMQLHCTHEAKLDCLKVRIGCSSTDRLKSQSEVVLLQQQISAALLEHRPLLKDLADQGLIHPLVVEIVSLSQLQVNHRTGKLRPLIDERFAATPES